MGTSAQKHTKSESGISQNLGKIPKVWENSQNLGNFPNGLGDEAWSVEGVGKMLSAAARGGGGFSMLEMVVVVAAVPD